MDGQHATKQIAYWADVVPRTKKQGAGADRRRLADAKNAICDVFGRQHPLDGTVRYPVRIHVIEFDDCRAGQQQG